MMRIEEERMQEYRKKVNPIVLITLRVMLPSVTTLKLDFDEALGFRFVNSS